MTKVIAENSFATMLTALKKPDLPPDAAADIHTLVEWHTEETPNAIAAVFDDQAITYAELNTRANQLAHRLIGLGVVPDGVVGIALDRSLEMVVALLAVLKAGGAYLWLDPSYPRERLEFVVEDTRPILVLTNGHLRDLLPADSGKRLCLDEEAKSLSMESCENPAIRGGSDDLAYVIYTSGSTGQPKGVAMGRRALCSLLRWQLQHWTAPASARTLQFTSLNFDVSFQEIFSTLCAGGTLILTSEEMRRDPSALLRLMRDRSVERIFLPFVALQQIAKAFEAEEIVPASLRDVITAGEQLQITPQIRKLFERLPGCTLHNQYGPAESHIIVTAFALRGAPEEWPLLPPIGRPVAEARIHILDEQRQPVAEGAIGEIHIGGAALARGYVNRATLTAERFIRDPFSADAEARLYRTGDLGQLLPDGNIQFLGRSDQQVKIRGVRVELGEVEAVMSQHPAVLQAAVCAKEVSVGDKRLIAYLVPKCPAPPKRDDLRAFLEAKLPQQFIPSAFVLMTSIPLTPNGKVDRLALSSLEEEDVRTLYDVEIREPKLPANEIQAQLIAIWEELLDKRPISVQANFFDIGGDSLLAVQLTVEIRKKLGKKLTTALIFRTPTIEALAGLLSADSNDQRDAAVQEFQRGGSAPPFFCAPGFVDLARNLGEEQPFYGLNVHLQQQVEGIETGIPEWAELCIREMRKIQLHGPYYIGGSSGAAALALEVAHQLQIAGERIGLLAFFNPTPPPGSGPLPWRLWLGKYWFQFRYLFRLDHQEKLGYLATCLSRLNTRILWQFRTLWDPAARRVRLMDAAYRLPENFVAPIAVFLPRDSYLRDKPEQDPRLDWRHLVTGSFSVHEVPGRHSTYMRDPHVQAVAGQLLNYLRPGSRTIAGSWLSLIPISAVLPTSWLVFG